MVTITSLSLILIPFSASYTANCQDYQDKMVLMQEQVGVRKPSVFLGYWNLFCAASASAQLITNQSVLTLLFIDYCRSVYMLDNWLHMSHMSSDKKCKSYPKCNSLSKLFIQTKVFNVQNVTKKCLEWWLGSYTSTVNLTTLEKSPWQLHLNFVDWTNGTGGHESVILPQSGVKAQWTLKWKSEARGSRERCFYYRGL